MVKGREEHRGYQMFVSGGELRRGGTRDLCSHLLLVLVAWQVEATKFTEVGFHGRDVDQIIRDLLENAIQLQRNKVP